MNPLFTIAGVLAVLVLFALGMSLFGRVTRRRERTKAIGARAKRARMTYDDFADEYRKAHRALEKRYCVLDVIHDLSEEWPPKDGAHQYISYEEAFYLCEKARRSSKSPLLLILHTLGGYSLPSEMIANAIKNHPAKKDAYIPYVAMSGGTVVALATDKIHMGKDAFLGPIDTQYAGFPVAAFEKLKADKTKDRIGDTVLLTSYLADQHHENAEKRAEKILNKHHMKVRGDPNFAIKKLMLAGLHHAEQISAARAADEMKLNIDTVMIPEVYALVDARLGMLRMSGDKRPPLLADPPPPPGNDKAEPMKPEGGFTRVAPIEAPPLN